MLTVFSARRAGVVPLDPLIMTNSGPMLPVITALPVATEARTAWLLLIFG
ncbi:hypothetical protein MLGJGCBP_06732 [Rhodococcus sp. T7]|nr:hypothetical protein MLGJGCBP_09826 [Rhodococcus sp. T7]KAF0960153.1 hypothetical protein MLGJGCBP_06732 [Rhodococcus sp. T7]